ncbi:hypothetical protein HO173_005097 [Letharia columbiana]|uniref:Uncharacterized protein n=1 Tax=Letharia columbiana TaxID=112416 RepID=A0A8H6FXX8_9LECA|nr:uncharacterized protein HO173_005097 [Letharia columbiana]KAF6236806.1 hypothetical protein HO173_005097 [Letharia columbiana]
MDAPKQNHDDGPTLKTRSDGPKAEPEETAPSRVQVFVLPADGTSPVQKFRPVINPSSETSSGPARRDDTTQANANDHVVTNSQLTLPDPCHGHWPADAWEKRGVFGGGFFHFLVTHLDEGLHPNPWTKGIFFGDVFVLVFFGTTGSPVLKDIFPKAEATPELESALLQLVPASFSA